MGAILTTPGIKAIFSNPIAGLLFFTALQSLALAIGVARESSLFFRLLICLEEGIILAVALIGLVKAGLAESDEARQRLVATKYLAITICLVGAVGSLVRIAVYFRNFPEGSLLVLLLLPLYLYAIYAGYNLYIRNKADIAVFDQGDASNKLDVKSAPSP